MSWSPAPCGLFPDTSGAASHASGLQRVVCSVLGGSLMFLRALWETRTAVTGWNLVVSSLN